MDYALSIKDIKKLCPDANIITYPKLTEYNNIDELLYPNNKLIILYMLEESFGHFCCLFVRDNNLCFFNSYGDLPDDIKTYTNVRPDILIQMHETKPRLFNMMRMSRYKNLYFNQYKLQGNKTDTCGRFCCVRLWMSELNDDEFKDFLTSSRIANPDQLVTLLTENVFKNFKLNPINFF